MDVAAAEIEGRTLRKVIRTTKFEFYLSIAMVVLVIASTVKFCWFPRPGEEIDTPGEWMTTGTFFLFFGVILPGLMIARYLRVSLVWDGDFITQHGLFRDEVVDLNRVTKVRWHHYRTGGMILTEGGKEGEQEKEVGVALWSYDMPPETRLEMIRLVYEQVPVENQTNWDVFFRVIVARTLSSVDPMDSVARSSPAKGKRDVVLLTLALVVLQLVCCYIMVEFVLPQFGRGAAMLTLFLPLFIPVAMIAWKSKQIRREAEDRVPIAQAKWDDLLARRQQESAEVDSPPNRE